MALSKDKKIEIIGELDQLLNSSKMIVMARYAGTSVQAMQELRQQADENGTKIKVVKNRLFKKAMSANDTFKDLDSTELQGQLLYAFNADDEVAPAQTLANFAKLQSQIEFVGALNRAGEWLPVEDVKVLASLPSKDQLRGQLVGTIAEPLSGFVGVMASNVRGLMNVLNAKAEQG